MKVWKLVIVVLAVGMFSVSAVAQDDCTSAVDVSNDLDPCTDSTPTGPLGSCTGGGGVQDVWLTFTATATTALIRTDLGSTGTDSDFIVYSGTCGDLTEIACSEDECYTKPAGCPGGTAVYWLGHISLKGLVVDDTYYIQLGSYADSCGPFHFTVTMPDDSGRFCGDNEVNVNTEECDGSDNLACLGGDCDVDCLCLPPSPALPVWGLIGLGVLLMGGGATAVARRRNKA